MHKFVIFEKVCLCWSKYINGDIIISLNDIDYQERVPGLQGGDGIGEHAPNAGNLWNTFLAAC